MSIFEMLNSLNSSKYFTGIIMLMLNIGSRHVELKLSDSMEAFVKYNMARELLIFSIAWMGTRDIIVALLLTAAFVVLSDFLLNANSKMCVLPNKYQYLNIDKNRDGNISDIEINNAMKTLERAKKQREEDRNMNLLNYFHEST
jgi:hypothetical protein